MRLSKQGAADLRLHEGFVPHFYRDAVGVGTIGVGFTWGSAAFRDWWGKFRPGQTFGPGATMSRAEAESCLVALADQEYGAAVVRFLGGRVVQQHVFDAMVSVVFNCGPGALAWSWATFARDGDYAAAAEKLRSTAITAKGRKLAGLISRRADEARLLEHGVYATGNAVTMPEDTALSDGVLERGERGEAVANLQRDLIRLGFQPGKADGIFGFGTEAALIAFQTRYGLTPDGLAGPKTLAKLKG